MDANVNTEFDLDAHLADVGQTNYTFREFVKSFLLNQHHSAKTAHSRWQMKPAAGRMDVQLTGHPITFLSVWDEFLFDPECQEPTISMESSMYFSVMAGQMQIVRLKEVEGDTFNSRLVTYTMESGKIVLGPSLRSQCGLDTAGIDLIFPGQTRLVTFDTPTRLVAASGTVAIARLQSPPPETSETACYHPADKKMSTPAIHHPGILQLTRSLAQVIERWEENTLPFKPEGAY